MVVVGLPHAFVRLPWTVIVFAEALSGAILITIVSDATIVSVISRTTFELMILRITAVRALLPLTASGIPVASFGLVVLLLDGALVAFPLINVPI